MVYWECALDVLFYSMTPQDQSNGQIQKLNIAASSDGGHSHYCATATQKTMHSGDVHLSAQIQSKPLNLCCRYETIPAARFEFFKHVNTRKTIHSKTMSLALTNKK